MERFNILRNYIKFYNNIQVMATYTIPRSVLKPSGTVENLVYAAMKEVMGQQPIMGVTIEDDGIPEPKWVRLPTIDLKEVMKVVDADPFSNVDALVQDAHRAQFERMQELPLWRLLVMAKASAKDTDDLCFAVGFFCHHAICDGISAAAFHLTFLDALNSVLSSSSATSSPSSILIVPALPLVPTLEMKTKLPLSLFFTLKQVIAAFIYSPTDPLAWTGPPISPNTPRPPICNTRSFTLPSHTIDALVTKCRNEKTSVTALTTVLVAQKLALMHPSHSHFSGKIPFSMRKFTGHTPRDMGCYVSQTLATFSSQAVTPAGYISCRNEPNEQLWESARACKSVIVERSLTTTDQDAGLLKFVARDIPGWLMTMLGKKRDHAFEVSNIGVVDGGTGGDIEGKAWFDRVMFSQGYALFP